ncbi:sirohydrochlorin chelatase [Streptomyces boluensis]|uniref:Sirohydrochlorin chelatase n=1 Tax=Streptomyces boluensis TaxID=1775135 RepID=A0A964XNH3_9ACTN|nr:sirohydrochlorin chelatase [Streptomyces boluensis]NBE54201.1 sirohydrochlorin chelatase [Streptomyces boluensis]
MTTPPPEPAAGRAALLVLGSGTRDAAAAAALRDLVHALELRAPELPVAGGLPGSATAPQDAALAALVERGAARVVAVPLDLAPAGRAHAADLAALARAAERHPATAYTCGRALGPDPVLMDVSERRVDAALAAVSLRERAAVTVLLVGPGSTDAAANAEVHRAARLLWEGRGYAGVEVAFVSPAAPDVPGGLDRCVRLGARRIVVLPYVLFDGALAGRVRQQAEGWAEAHPDVDVRAADPVGPAPELIDLVLARYREAAGDTWDRDATVAVSERMGPAHAY